MKISTCPNFFRVVALSIAVLLVTGFITVTFADLNVKAGFNYQQKMDIKTDGYRGDGKLCEGYHLNCEYLTPLISAFKIGGGVEFCFPRMRKDAGRSLEFSWLPIYFTVQVNPFQNGENEKGIFFKGNIGYIVDFSSTEAWIDAPTKVDDKGGLYFALSTGYELPCGLILEIIYSQYRTNSERSEDKIRTYKSYWTGETYSYIDTVTSSWDFFYSRIGINVGYKFNI
jgi:hypothetical protein